jgi:hypothetical protein
MVWYNQGKVMLLDPSFAGVGEPPLALLLDRITPGLMRAAYVVDIDTDIDWGDVVVNTVVATGYTDPGSGAALELASKATVVDLPNDRAEFDAADLVYTGIGNGTNDTFDTVIIARELDAGQTDVNTLLIAVAEGLSATTTNGGNITLVWNVEGILQITA